MKKAIWFLPIMIFALFLPGCGKKMHIPTTSSIEIAVYATNDGDGIRSGDLEFSFIVDSADDMEHICGNFNSLTLKKMTYNKPTVLLYVLSFRDQYGRETMKIAITVHRWIDVDGHFHTVTNGDPDWNYIDDLVNAERTRLRQA